ncbi:translation factor GUF1, mitochondrial isoform X3 [Bubalus kerabau]|uniref:translation factor GUF1, mitochondrial isoform X8 n=1 Tax=Bubalus bubalis TaxID=89462 RepID=UPI001D1225E5|nr:translation factor GUF1, mitochondrial isoform X8 [Bubalus bubalis]XP_055444424.1 translation factor GUF1, mitochondrial isoform X3 [Bubalus carabanensis]
MWTLAGQGWWRGRALAAWVTEAARKGRLWPHLAPARGTAAESRAPDRCYSSADRKEKIDMSCFPVENTRNFSIIAHVDHGKSTLADRLLELTGAIDKTKNNKQVLDKLQVERERGITVKAQTASLFYNYEGKQYLLNLIDTPGHVDFSYEVSRSLSACQGVLLVVDANEGIQAQTVANFFLAFEAQLSIIPVINKIDLKNADPERVEKQIEKVFDIPGDECIKISAKLGTNVESVLDAVIKRIPSYAGQVGYLIAGMKDVTEAQIGDTLYLHKQPVEPLPGFKSAKPMVFAGMYPVDQSEYNNLKSAIEKLTLNDSSVVVHRDSSLALGAGWRLGFLGLLHMEVFNQRLEQEYNASVILTTPTVPYKAVLSSAKLIKEYREKEITIINPAQFPDKSKVTEYLEPVVLGTIITPDEYTGKIMMLCQARRAVQKNMMYIDQNRVMLKYLFPLNEIVVDFYDSLKSLSSGYASFDYEDAGYQTAELVKMDILLNGNIVEELVTVVHKDKAYSIGKAICERLKDSLPRQLFEIAIQAALGSKIIARETVKAYRKNVLAKCYGGDITRKMKLLKRQAEGKKKLRKVGNVEVPKDAFIKVLKTQSDK